jgi:hypothetical protein
MNFLLKLTANVLSWVFGYIYFRRLDDKATTLDLNSPSASSPSASAPGQAHSR